MLSTLLAQLVFIFLVALVVNLTSSVTENPNGKYNITMPGTDGNYYGETKRYDVGGLLVIFPPGTANSVFLFMACMMMLPLISYIREKHPWNLIFMFTWSLFWGIFMGVSQVPGGFFQSNALFVMFGFITFAVGIFVVLSACLTHYDKEREERRLVSVFRCGFFAWLIATICCIAFYYVRPSWYSSFGIYFVCWTGASIIFIWFVSDSSKLCKRMNPDEYWKGVVYLYTDWMLLCCFCCTMGMI